MFIKPLYERMLRAADAEAGGGGDDKADDIEIKDNSDGSATNALDLIGDKKPGGEQQGDKKDPPDKKDQTQDPPVNRLIYKTRPDWVPENFYDKKTGEVDVQGLAKSQKDLRDKIAKGLTNVPAKPEDYKIEISDELKPVAKNVFVEGDPAKDPAMKWLRVAAHELKLNQEQVNGLVNRFVQFGQEAGMVVAPIDVKAEAAKIGPAGLATMRGVKTFVENLANKGVFTEAETAAVRSWFLSAEDFTAFNKVRQAMGWNETPIPLDHNSAAQGQTRESLRKRMGDVLAKANKGDRSAAAEYEKLQADYEKAYGTEPAGSSLVG